MGYRSSMIQDGTMSKGRKKEKRFKLAGKRLLEARNILGKSYQTLVTDNRWEKCVGVYDSKTVRGWVHNGLPENRIGAVASYFGVRGDRFTDPGIDSLEFSREIYAQRHRREHPESEKETEEKDSVLFDWNGLAAEMKLLSRQPVYAEPHCTLQDIFISRNAQFKHNGDRAWDDVGDLTTYLLNFNFGNERKKKRPVILYGDFGIGKTSFLKMFAAHLVSENHRYFPVYIPLRELPLHSPDNPAKAIAGYLDKFGDFRINQVAQKLLLLLDGFDELNYFRNDIEWIKKAFRQLLSLYRYPNIHILISSRPILFLKEENNIPEGSPIINILELENMQIGQWIDAWKKTRGHTRASISLKGLETRNLLPVTRNPLLLYMTAKIFDTELTEKLQYSKGIIYQRFYDWTIQGKFEKDEQAHILPGNYRETLQNIAMTIRSTGANNEYIDYEALKQGMERLQLTFPGESVFRDSKILLVAHFFKAGKKDELRYIEFAHKSFREYLVAEKIFDYFRSIIKKKQFDPIEWLGMGRMLPSREEFDFLGDLLRTLKREELIWLKKKLTSGRMLPLLVSTGTFRKVLEETNLCETGDIGTIYFRSINLSCLTYIAVNLIQATLRQEYDGGTDDESEISETPAKKYATAYIYHTCQTTVGSIQKDSRYNKNWVTAKAFMGGLDQSGLVLDGVDFSYASLNRTTFVNSSLKRCSFFGADAILTDFSGTDCQGADYSKSFCSNTIFAKSRLHQVTFRDAEVYCSDFRDAELVNVDFSGTRLEGCVFDGCNMKSVIFDPEKIVNCRGFGNGQRS